MADKVTPTADQAVEPVTEPIVDPVVEAEAVETTSPEEVARIRAALAKANKEAEGARRKLKEADDAKLSEVEKAQRDAAEATQRADKLERTNLLATVALEEGVPAKWVARLVGETEDELRADAKSILADLNKTKKPEPDPSQGPRQTAKVSGWDAGKAEAQKRFGK